MVLLNPLSHTQKERKLYAKTHRVNFLYYYIIERLITYCRIVVLSVPFSCLLLYTDRGV